MGQSASTVEKGGVVADVKAVAEGQITDARARIADHLLEIDNITLQVNPRIEAEYATKIGYLENDLLKWQIAARRAKRRLALAQARVNAGASLRGDEFEVQLDYELAEWESLLDRSVKMFLKAAERAFECLSEAAEADIPEACYKLGDLYKHGTGCESNATEAFRWYVRASELATRERPVILGSIALRLAGCYEEGFGCTLDFSKALEWYKKAAAGLEFAVENGETWYEKALAGARAGVKRCQQEVAE